MFKVGDKVRCINNQWSVDDVKFGITDLLKLNEIYTVNQIDHDYVVLDKGTWLSERFELVESDTTKVIVLDDWRKDLFLDTLENYISYTTDELFEQLNGAETITITATFKPSNQVYLFSDKCEPENGWFIAKDEDEDNNEDDYLCHDGTWVNLNNSDTEYRPDIYYTLRQAKDTAIKFGYEPVVKD